MRAGADAVEEPAPHFHATKILLGIMRRDYSAEMRRLVPIETKGALPPPIAAVHASEEARRTRLARSATARLAWERAHRVTAPERDDTRTAAERAQLDGWYRASLQPRFSGLRTIDVARARTSAASMPAASCAAKRCRTRATLRRWRIPPGYRFRNPGKPSITPFDKPARSSLAKL